MPILKPIELPTGVTASFWVFHDTYFNPTSQKSEIRYVGYTDAQAFLDGKAALTGPTALTGNIPTLAQALDAELGLHSATPFIDAIAIESSELSGGQIVG